MTVSRSKPNWYHGGNATRASVVQNPAAYANDQKSGLFGVKEFRTFGFASEEVRDAAAEKQINRGYSRKRNPLCPEHFIQMSNTGVCPSC
jgi:hypothetical protein